ncbi:hypothetical protein B0H19DRAFT_1299610, partial [Mycena capillaripes]
FRNLQRLAVYIYFDRSIPLGNILAVVVHSIAYWLAKFNVYFESALCAALDADPSLVTAHFSIQVQKLLHEPLKAACNHICGPVVIVLDALDECLDSNSRVTLARWIASEEFSKLPLVFQLLITSRPDSDIQNHFQNKKHITTRDLYPVLDNTESDIERYFRAGLQEIQQSHALEPEWPGVTAIHMLTQLSGNLFIWAATAYRFINQYNPEKKLELLFNSRSTISESLDNLYTVALNSCAQWDDPDFCNDACLVLALVTLWQVPLNDKEMDLLLELKSGTSAKILTKLACVFRWTSGNHPRPLHASFSDYLLASNRSGEHPWHVNTRAWNSVLALKCLRILNSKLKFNICELKTSYLRNDEVPNLSGKIKECISSDLAYASRFWAAHVEIADSEKTMLNAIKDFMFTQFLYWLEVLSLSGHVNSANRSISQALHCLQGSDTELDEFLKDALKFISGFGSVMMQSAPHIYISALAFAPEKSLVRNKFKSRFQNIGHFDSKLGDNWAALQKILSKHMGVVRSVAFSPDGNHIVSGSSDQTVRIWDAHTGAAVGEPLEGHTRSVRSVAFSPDGNHIVSGSNDRTVRIWDAHTGAAVGEPLEGHTHYVQSVAFSPDGNHIVSGSFDQTVRIWDAHTGAAVGEPLEGHTHYVQSVAFSPDGNHIVSGSDDQTVR